METQTNALTVLGRKPSTKILERSTKGRILQCFLNADMRNGHEGLEKVAKDNKIDVANLLPGQYVVFINSQKNKLKVYATNNVVAYLRLKEGKIDMNTIQLIPQAFNGPGQLNYDKALREAVEESLRRKTLQ